MTTAREYKLRERERESRRSKEGAGAYLEWWLNEEHRDPHSVRLAETMKMIARLFRFHRRFRGPFHPSTRAGAADFFYRMRIAEGLNAVRREYRVHDVTAGPRGQLLIEDMPHARGVAGSAYQDFQDAFVALFTLNRESRLGYLRQCEQCGRWFYARKKDERFHDANCREAWHSKQPARRALRAKYMRNYRSEQQKAKARAQKRRDQSELERLAAQEKVKTPRLAAIAKLRAEEAVLTAKGVGRRYGFSAGGL